jgi:hypothetical protein
MYAKYLRAGISILTLLFSYISAYATDDIQTCKEGSSPSVISCLETALKKSKIKYNSLSKLVARQMVELDAATLRHEAVKTYEASEESFKAFIRKNCAWHMVTAIGGITGMQNRLICEISLTHMRIRELRAQLGH